MYTDGKGKSESGGVKVWINMKCKKILYLMLVSPTIIGGVLILGNDIEPIFMWYLS